MPVRLAACDPCRFSKLACDHAQPICTRCQQTGRSAGCVYRTRPFKRKNRTSKSSVTSQVSHPSTKLATSYAKVPSKPRTYPNPGYQGSSSHVAIFDHLPSDELQRVVDHLRSSSQTYNELPDLSVDEAQVSYGARLIEQIQSSSNTNTYCDLIQAWNARGINLALTGLFTKQCADTAIFVFNPSITSESDSSTISKNLFLSSYRPLEVSSDTSLSDFCQLFSQSRARWETIGLFFTAVSRATIDLSQFEPLYSNEEQRRSLRKLTMHYSDRCLDIALSLDCLNDLLLMFQYENFILHSYVEGDQSFQSWRKLGDVVSSLFALGHHEQVQEDNTSPAFLTDLRRSAFARTYSADKNISIFLGRPPRILKRYSRFYLPGNLENNLEASAIHESNQEFEWMSSTTFDYRADTWWSALCAILKEETLDLCREPRSWDRTVKAENVETRAGKQWLLLPKSLRLEGPLRLCDRTSQERDFMVSAKLNHLHVLFLVRSTLIRRISDADPLLIKISATMLSLTIEGILLKDQLVNSGTSLVWRVAYYALPAAGILCLALLHNFFARDDVDVELTKVFRELDVLVAEVESGALVHVENPNYTLLAGAAQTIKSILERTLRADSSKRNDHQSKANVPSQGPTTNFDDQWVPWANNESWDFEIDFWMNLAEHPHLVDLEETTAI